MLKVARMYTDVITQSTTGAVGSFSTIVEIDDMEFQLSTDKKGLVQHHIARHVAGGIINYDLPPDIWHVEVYEPYASKLGLPAKFTMGGK